MTVIFNNYQFLILFMESMNKLSRNNVKNSKNSCLQSTKKRLSILLSNEINQQTKDLLNFDQCRLKQNSKNNQNCNKLGVYKFDLSQYFKNFDNYINDNMIIFQKRFQVLNDGLYILIKGKICYVWNTKLQDAQKKQNLFNAAKSGIFSLANDPCLQEPQQQYSILLDNPMTIIQCQHQNCLVIQDSILIKIESQTRKQSKFDQLYEERYDLISNSHLNHYQQNKGFEVNRIFGLNMKLHNSFKKYKYFFHHLVHNNTIAIVCSGIVKPIKNQGTNKYFQLQRYAILLPGVKYEVISSQAQIMTVQKNQGLVYFHSQLRNAHLKVKQSNNKLFGHGYCYSEGSKRIKCSRSLQVPKSESDITCNMKRWQINKRKKLLTNITKTYYNQLTIPMVSCKQTLQFSEKQMQVVKKQINNTMQILRYKKPKILFDYKKHSPKNYQSFHGVLQQLQNKNCNYVNKKTLLLKKGRRQRKTFNQREHYLEKYQHISKQLYNKFIHAKTSYYDFCKPIRSKQQYSIQG